MRRFRSGESILCLAMIAFGSSRALGQLPASPLYPPNDRLITVAKGDVITLLNSSVFVPPSQSGKQFNVQYMSRIAASDTVGRRAEADRAAAYFGPQAIELGAQRLALTICDTRTCAEAREAPAVLYLYRHGADGVWRREIRQPPKLELQILPPPVRSKPPVRPW